MSYRIAQSEKYLHGSYWRWSVWIEATPAELDELEQVTWILHPTFSPSTIENRNRETNFRLDASGWGTFVLRAGLHVKGQPDTVTISHTLKLTYPPDDEAAASPNPPRHGSASADKVSKTRTPTVFLSYSSEDNARAQVVRNVIEKLGARVVDASSVSADLPFDAAIPKMIRESDGVIGIFGSDYASPWVLTEMHMAEADEKPTLHLLAEDIERPPELPAGAAELRLGPDGGAAKSGLEHFLSGFAGGDDLKGSEHVEAFLPREAQ